MHAVFFGTDFASRFAVRSAGLATGEVVGILGIADDEAMEGRVVAAARTLRYAGHILVRADDVLESLEALPSLGVRVGARFRVLEAPRRVNDGAEWEALLGGVSA